MAQLMLINTRKRRARKAAPKRRTRRVAHNPIRRRSHTASRRRVRRNPIAARHMRRIHRRRARRNPIGGTGVMATLMNGFVGGAGAVLVDVVQGYLPLPVSLMGGYGAYAVKAGLGILLGTFGRKVLGQSAVKMGAGAVTVAMYGAIKTATAGMLPGTVAAPAVAGLGYMNPTATLSEYINGPGSMAGMGEWVNGAYSAYPNANY